MNAPDDEAPAAGGAAARASGNQESKQHDSALSPGRAAIRAEIEQHDQHVAALRARASRAGYQLHILAAGNGTSTFMIARWGRVHECDLVGVEAFLDRAAGRTP